MQSYILEVCGHIPETAVSRCFTKCVISKISQNSKKNTCVGVSFINKVAGPKITT